MCPGGEGAVLKTVASKGVAGSNPVHGASLVSRRIDAAQNICE